MCIRDSHIHHCVAEYWKYIRIGCKKSGKADNDSAACVFTLDYADVYKRQELGYEPVDMTDYYEQYCHGLKKTVFTQSRYIRFYFFELNNNCLLYTSRCV